MGLSSPPGILYLVKQGYNLEVWNRSTEKASKLLKQNVIINKLDLDKLKLELNSRMIIRLKTSKVRKLNSIVR